MHRKQILQLLNRYPLTGQAGQVTLDEFRQFIEENPHCFERTLDIGHLTGSAWVVSPDRSRVLLTHHHRLDRWLQLGGHADGDPDIFAVAWREAREESGLTALRPLSGDIFDLDLHLIPARPTEAAHYHYDVRFIFEADPTAPLVISKESKDLAWVRLTEVGNLEADESVLRMVEKTQALFAPP